MNIFNPKRILIIRTDRLGDVVITTPIIHALREKYPDSFIAIMVRPEYKDIVINNPDLDEVIFCDKRGKHKSILGIIKLGLFTLRNKKFDLGIAFHPTNRAHFLMFLANIKKRVGYDRKMSFFLTDKFYHLKQKGEKHEIDYLFDLLQFSGVTILNPNRIPQVITSKEDKEIINSVIKDLGLSNNIIAIHPGASCLSKKWSGKKFAEVADTLKEKYSSDIVIVGEADTEEISKTIKDNMKFEAIDLTGNFLLGEFSEFLSRCRMLISNDSGPVHLAVSVGIPVVSIFGRKDPGLSPKRWGPLGAKDIYLHKDVGCKKCLAHNCDRGFACINAIEPEEVISAVQRILGNT